MRQIHNADTGVIMWKVIPMWRRVAQLQYSRTANFECQKMTFKASWIWRAEVVVAVIEPAVERGASTTPLPAVVPAKTVALGIAKLALFNRLKNSARNSR